jgi:hypothetical protein
MTKWAIALTLVGIVLALLVGFLLARPLSRYDPVREARAEALRLESELRQERSRALEPVTLLFYGGLAIVGIAAAGLGIWAGFLYLRRKAMTVYPDHNGVMPLLVLRPGEMVVDGGAMAGPIAVSRSGLTYQLPPDAVPRLQVGANQGAAMTRSLRAWATHPAPSKQSTQQSAYHIISEATEPRREFPPVELLTGDEAHILRLLEEGKNGS